MTVNVAGHLADVSFDTGAATAKGSMPKFTALSPTLPDFDLALPPRVGEGDVFDGRVAPSDDSVHSVNNLAALPRQQKELPCVAKLLCSIPVQPYSSVNSFSPLALVSKVSPLQLDQFQLELRYHLIRMLGRWSSDAYQIYIRTPVSALVRVSNQLVE